MSPTPTLNSRVLFRIKKKERTHLLIPLWIYLSQRQDCDCPVDHLPKGQAAQAGLPVYCSPFVPKAQPRIINSMMCVASSGGSCCFQREIKWYLLFN